MEIWFSKDVTDSCATGVNVSRVRLTTTSSAVFDGIRSLAISARLAGRLVEVNTSGCDGELGKLTYLSF